MACKNAAVLFNRLKQVSSQAAVLADLTSKMLFSWTKMLMSLMLVREFDEV